MTKCVQSGANTPATPPQPTRCRPADRSGGAELDGSPGLRHEQSGLDGEPSWPGPSGTGTNDGMAAHHKKPAVVSGNGSAAAGSAVAPSTPSTDVPTGPAPFSATRQAEIETKLEIEPTAKLPSLTKRRRLAAVGIVAAADPKSYSLDATYYDTAGLDLLRSRMTLRRRTGGPDAGWHLKLPAVQGARTEVGLPLTAGEPGDVPAELAGLVRGAARGRDLVPVARLENDRTVRHLLDQQGEIMIEVADDHVTATPLLTGAGKPSQWRELEAEIIRGTRDQLAATVEVLMSAGASRASRLGFRSAADLAEQVGGHRGAGVHGPPTGPADRRRPWAPGGTRDGRRRDA